MGLRLKNKLTGEVVDVEDDDDLEAKIEGQGLVVATQEEIDLFDQGQKYGGAGNTLRAAGETALDTATFGAAGAVAEAYGEGEAFEGRREVLAREHAGVDFASQAAGSIAVGLAGGAVAGGAAKALGAGAKLAQGAAVIGEGAASGLADETQMAERQDREISIGNAMLLGVGGELIGRAIPKAFSKALTGRSGKIVRATPEAQGVLARADVPASKLDPDAPSLGEYSAALEDGGLSGALGRAAKKKEDMTSDQLISEGVLKERVVAARGLTNKAERQAEFAEIGDVIVREEAESIAKRVGPAEATAREFNDRGDNVRSQKVLRTQLEGIGDIPEQIDAMRSLDAHLDDMSREFTESRVSDAARATRGWKDLERARHIFAKKIQTEDRVVMMQATRKYKQALQATHTSLADMKLAGKFDSEDLTDFQRLVDAEEGPIRAMMESEDLWGAAGKTEAAINLNFHKNLMPRVGFRDKGVRSITGRSYDAQPGGGRRVQEIDRGKVESLLNQTEGARDLQRQAAVQEAAYYTETARIHGPDGTGLMTKAQVQEQIDASDTILSAFDLADEIAVARSLKKHTETSASPGTGGVLGQIASTVGGVASGIPGAGFAMRSAGLFSINDAAKGRFLRTAQKLTQGASRASSAVAERGGAPLATTVLSRFQGNYQSPQASYLAKRTIIEDATRDPMTAVKALTDSLMGIAESDPDLFAGIAGRQMEMLNYVAQNLPAGIETTLEHPNGVPPSDSEIREIAVLWQAVFDPNATVEGIADQSTTPQGFEHMRAVHPDIATDLQKTIVEEAQISPELIPTGTKTYLQNTMGMGYLFGAVYTPAIVDAFEVSAPPPGAAQSAPPQSTPPSEQEGSAASQPSGISAIHSSVTNA